MKTKAEYNKCLVLDASYMPRSIITTERAFTIFYKGNAEIVDNHYDYDAEEYIKFKVANPELELYKPSIIRVKKNMKVDFHKTKLSRENVFKRDNYTCVYCPCDDRKKLTIDHVIPKSRGGKDTWENLVTACFDCNQEKDDLSLEEYGKEIPVPRRPHYLMLLKTITWIPEEWKVYLLY